MERQSLKKKGQPSRRNSPSVSKERSIGIWFRK